MDDNDTPYSVGISVANDTLWTAGPVVGNVRLTRLAQAITTEASEPTEHPWHRMALAQVTHASQQVKRTITDTDVNPDTLGTGWIRWCNAGKEHPLFRGVVQQDKATKRSLRDIDSTLDLRATVRSIVPEWDTTTCPACLRANNDALKYYVTPTGSSRFKCHRCGATGDVAVYLTHVFKGDANAVLVALSNLSSREDQQSLFAPFTQTDTSEPVELSTSRLAHNGSPLTLPVPSTQAEHAVQAWLDADRRLPASVMHRVIHPVSPADLHGCPESLRSVRTLCVTPMRDGAGSIQNFQLRLIDPDDIKRIGKRRFMRGGPVSVRDESGCPFVFCAGAPRIEAGQSVIVTEGDMDTATADYLTQQVNPTAWTVWGGATAGALPGLARFMEAQVNHGGALPDRVVMVPHNDPKPNHKDHLIGMRYMADLSDRLNRACSSVIYPIQSEQIDTSKPVNLVVCGDTLKGLGGYSRDNWDALVRWWIDVFQLNRHRIKIGKVVTIGTLGTELAACIAADQLGIKVECWIQSSNPDSRWSLDYRAVWTDVLRSKWVKVIKPTGDSIIPYADRLNQMVEQLSKAKAPIHVWSHVDPKESSEQSQQVSRLKAWHQEMHFGSLWFAWVCRDWRPRLITLDWKRFAQELSVRSIRLSTGEVFDPAVHSMDLNDAFRLFPTSDRATIESILINLLQLRIT